MQPPPPIYTVGWVGFGWQRQRHYYKTCRLLRELDYQDGTSTHFFFGGGGIGGRPQLVVELEHLCEVKNLYSAQGS